MERKSLTDVEETAGYILPDGYQLINFPNPFNSSTQVQIRIPEAGFISIKVYNIIGEEIAEIVNNYFTAGSYKFLFDAKELSSGIYLLKMNSGEKYISHKIILLR